MSQPFADTSGASVRPRQRRRRTHAARQFPSRGKTTGWPVVRDFPGCQGVNPGRRIDPVDPEEDRNRVGEINRLAVHLGFPRYRGRNAMRPPGPGSEPSRHLHSDLGGVIELGH